MACDWAAPSSAPLGALAVACPMVARKVAVERPAPASAAGSTCTRTAGCCPPPTNTCPTPSTWEIFWASTVLAVSNTLESGSVRVAVEVELEGQAGRAERAHRGDLGQPGDAAEATLERRRHRRGHRLGAGAGEAGLDVDG